MSVTEPSLGSVRLNGEAQKLEFVCPEAPTLENALNILGLAINDTRKTTFTPVAGNGISVKLGTNHQAIIGLAPSLEAKKPYRFWPFYDTVDSKLYIGHGVFAFVGDSGEVVSPVTPTVEGKPLSIEDPPYFECENKEEGTYLLYLKARKDEGIILMHPEEEPLEEAPGWHHFLFAKVSLVETEEDGIQMDTFTVIWVSDITLIDPKVGSSSVLASSSSSSSSSSSASSSSSSAPSSSGGSSSSSATPPSTDPPPYGHVVFIDGYSQSEWTDFGGVMPDTWGHSMLLPDPGVDNMVYGIGWDTDNDGIADYWSYVIQPLLDLAPYQVSDYVGSSSSSSSGSSSSSSKTIILPSPLSPTGYHGLVCVESPEAWFTDVMVVRMTGSRHTLEVDPRFEAVCEDGTIRVTSITANGPSCVWWNRERGKLVLRRRWWQKAPIALTVVLHGIRKGHSYRFPQFSREQYLNNEKFYASAHSKSGVLPTKD